MRDGGAEKAQKGYIPLAGLGRDKGFLRRNRVFKFCVATGFDLGKVFLGHDRVCSLL